MKRILRLGSLDQPARSSFRPKLKGDKILRGDGYTLLYLGSNSIVNLRSQHDALASIHIVKQTSHTQRPVQLLCKGVELRVMGQEDEELLTCGLVHLVQCVHHSAQGFSDCVGLVFSSGPWALQCHVFQAKTPREAADIVQSLQRGMKFVTKHGGSKKVDYSISNGDFTRESPILHFTGTDQTSIPGSERVRRKSDIVRPETTVNHSPVLRTTRSESMSSLGRILRTPPTTAHQIFKKGKEKEKPGTRQEHMETVRKASHRVEESNKSLRAACRNLHPQSPFERALNAIHTSSTVLLCHLLDQGLLAVESCDHDGNSLLHYAVAEGRVNVLHALHERLASFESPNSYKLRPLHRAAAAGNRPILKALLEKGANVNAFDSMKNTPLHYVAGHPQHLECLWTLLEHGGTINSCNSLGIRPYDLQPDLREMQNRLVTSVCQSFSEPQERTPSLSPPVSSTQVSLHTYENYSIGDLLDLVQGRARSLQSWALRKNKYRKSLSRSFSNLSELLESEEDEMHRQDRMKQLQFPLAAEYTPEYYEMEGRKEQVQRKLNELIKQARSTRRILKRSSSDPELPSPTAEDMEEEDRDRPSELTGVSMAFKQLLQRFQPDSSLQSHLFSPKPVSSQPNPRRSNHQRIGRSTLSQAFDELQQDLEAEHSVAKEPVAKMEEVVKISPHSAHRVKPIRPDSSPFLQPRSKEETVAILDDYIATIMNAAGDTSLSSGNNSKREGNVSASVHDNQRFPHSPRTVSHKRHSAAVRSDLVDSSSSSETPRRFSMADAARLSHRSSSAASSLDLSPSRSSSLSSLHYASQHGSLSNLPFDMDSTEPGSKSLWLLVLLSSNRECLQTLTSHICLPKFTDRLLSLATSSQSSVGLLSNIANLIHNIYEVGGVEGRKNAIESGILDITVKLLSARDPIPGTCLMLLNSLLVSDDDNDYLRTIVRIPCGPLLAFLEPCESDVDSGLDSRHRDTTSSSGQTSADEMAGGKSTGEGTRGQFLMPPGAIKDRAFSLISATSDSSSTRSAVSPSLQGQFVTHMEARRIVLKMLAVCSTHVKMKATLTEFRTLALLNDYLTNPSQENVTNSAIALANIAQSVQSHCLLLQVGVLDKLRTLLNNGPRPRYHAMRALIYLGKLKMRRFHLFQANSSYEVDSSVLQVDGSHSYIRGATVEHAVELITGNCRMLWGGISLRDSSGHHFLSKEKTVEFFLTTFRSFVHPLILMRLLLHRLDTQHENINPFNWSMEPEDIHHSHTSSIHPTHQAVLSLLGQWLETFPEDFRNLPQLREYVVDVLQRLKRLRGVYTPHTHQLRSLLHDLQRPPRKSDVHSISPVPDKMRAPHHENLYIQCKQLVSEDLLPLTLDQAVSLAALQLHVETLLDSSLEQAFFEGSGRSKKDSRILLTHLKHALPAWCFRLKNVGKKVKEKLLEYQEISERNSKHMYIEKCQNSPGYNCSFYSVKVPNGGKFRRGSQAQLLGINDSKLVLLDDKTRELVSVHCLSDVTRVHHSPSDPCNIMIQIKSTSLKIHVERESTARQIEMILDNLGQRVLQGYEQEDIDEWESSWALSPPSIHASDEQNTLSTSSSPEHILEYSPMATEGKYEFQNGNLLTPDTIKPSSPSPLEDTLQPFSQATPTILATPTFFATQTHLTFCDCPPDPEIPPHVDVKLMSLNDILLHQTEVARQLTLIEHERTCSITREELMQRAGLLPRPQPEPQSSSHSLRSLSSSTMSSSEGGIERLAYRFNQLGNWVVHCVLQYHNAEDRAWALQQFIQVAHCCFKYRNYSSTMAIVVTGLLSPPVRRLRKTWEYVDKQHYEKLQMMDNVLSSKNNYTSYRAMLEKTLVPAVPFFGIFTRDLQFIRDGNPDYLHNGLVNLHKRRQIFAKLEEIRHFQSDRYNFEPVPALQELLENHVIVCEEELHSLSHSLEQAGSSHMEARQRSNSISSLTGFIRHSTTRNSTASNSNLVSL